jgi:hypothetical protein
MFCTHCGSQVPEDSVFCENCGSTLGQSVFTSGNEFNLPEKVTLLLPILFRTNAFHILGLDTGSDTKMVQKRVKEITTHLKIADLPQYDLDIEKPELFRNETSVKEALQKVNSPKSGIWEYYFWFDFSADPHCQELFESMKNADYRKILLILKKSAENSGKNSFSEKRNLAVFYSILLNNNNFKFCLNPSLELWKILFGSDECWDTFFLSYSGKTGFNLDIDIKKEIKNQAITKLSDLFTEISQRLNDPDYLLEYKEFFSVIGKKTEKDVLDPVLQKIHACIEELKILEISPNNKNNPVILQRIDDIIVKILDEIDVLSSFGLDENSQVKTIRDQAAETVREIGVKIHNVWDNLDSALELINTARDICGTTSLSASLEGDIRQIQETKDNSLILKPIDESLSQKQFSKALQSIEYQESLNKNQNLNNLLKDRKKVCVTGISIERYKEAMDAFNKNKNEEAKNGFEYTASLIQRNFDLFNFNKNAIDDILNDIPHRIDFAITIQNFQLLDAFRNSIIEAAKKTFEGQYEEDILIILIDSYLYSSLLRRGLISSNQQTKSTSSCFVITAAMGDRLHPNVLLLQMFRDTWLIRRRWGRVCNTLYEKIGPFFADIIRNNKNLQFISRLIIVAPGVWIAKKMIDKKTK